jgi:hypothetical protein
MPHLWVQHCVSGARFGGKVREAEFRDWLLNKGYAAHSVDSDISRMRRVEAAMPDYDLPDRDLDSAFERDELEGVLAALRGSIDALPEKTPPEALVPRSNNYDERLRKALRCTELYRDFCREADGAAPGDAERVRRYALDRYIRPARTQGRPHVDIPVREVNEALDLKNHYKNICQALAGPKMQALAGVPAPARPEKIDSPFTIFRFELGGFDRRMLERLRRMFEQKYPDFRDFTESAGYGSAEDDYKRALIARTDELLTEYRDADDAALGAALLDLISGRGGLRSNLLDWRVAKLVADIRSSVPGVMEEAAGSLARDEDGIAAVAGFAERMWPYLNEKVPGSRPFAESRTIPTMVRAMVDPLQIIGIRSTPTDNAAKMLLGRPAFALQPLTASELEGVVGLARRIFDIMKDEWRWKPRDLWDVQGFFWETCQKRLAPDENRAVLDDEMDTDMDSPTNLILYGPPGTGKTYATAREAVRLCGESVPDDREELMALYRSLAQKGRIEFVTFHQNFSYEDFVEGLRPTSSDSEDDGDASAGFSLQAQDGIFKQIADVAASNRGKVIDNGPRSIDRSRKVFKMSLGRSRSSADDIIYQDALRDGYVVLGWGGDVDWSDCRYDEWEAIKERWRQDHPEASGNDPNMSQMYTFRINMEVGSLVIVSDGNRKFRAIGEVTGPYQFVPGPNGEYNHRRSVRWLWHSDESLPRERVYSKELSQVSVYQMNSRYVNWDGLEQTVTTGGDDAATSGTPEGHVLIIDEINRANISKVFGELITLIEADKRLGMPNALTVRLPYSKTLFGVPANLHIIGTMNTADRSIALLDTALRRRFTFREIAPEPELLADAAARCGIALPAILGTINDRIEYLIDREHRIGHAFFMDCATRADVDAVMRDKIIPLLEEFFFEDWGRIRAVLGHGFIGERTLKAPPGFDGLERKSWFVRMPFAEDAYERLVSPSGDDDAIAPEAQSA